MYSLFYAYAFPDVIKFDFLENEKNFRSEVFSFRLKKQTSKNVLEATFKEIAFRNLRNLAIKSC